MSKAFFEKHFCGTHLYTYSFMFKKPVRKIRPSNRSITGKWPSLKTNSSQHFESTLERDLITLLEFDDEV